MGAIEDLCLDVEVFPFGLGGRHIDSAGIEQGVESGAVVAHGFGDGVGDGDGAVDGVGEVAVLSGSLKGVAGGAHIGRDFGARHGEGPVGGAFLAGDTVESDIPLVGAQVFDGEPAVVGAGDEGGRGFVVFAIGLSSLSFGGDMTEGTQNQMPIRKTAPIPARSEAFMEACCST